MKTIDELVDELAAVSYTHLDVYKRQAYKGEVSMYKLNDIHNSDVGNKGNFEKMVISEADRVKPVSYTHLDVYKRQVEGGVDDWGEVVTR